MSASPKSSRRTVSRNRFSAAPPASLLGSWREDASSSALPELLFPAAALLACTFESRPTGNRRPCLAAGLREDRCIQLITELVAQVREQLPGLIKSVLEEMVGQALGSETGDQKSTRLLREAKAEVSFFPQLPHRNRNGSCPPTAVELWSSPLMMSSSLMPQT